MIIISDPSSQYPNWMGRKWSISQVDPNAGLVAHFADVVEFQSSSQVTAPDPWGTLDPFTSTASMVTGVTSGGQRFQIVHQEKENQLICQIDSSQRAFLVKNIVLGATSATVVATVVEIAAGLPASTFFVILLSAAIASTVAALTVQSDSARSGNATWVANDGGAGVVAESQPFRVMSA